MSDLERRINEVLFEEGFVGPERRNRAVERIMAIIREEEEELCGCGDDSHDGTVNPKTGMPVIYLGTNPENRKREGSENANHG